MKTRMSHRFLLIAGLSALLANPAFAAFGDDTSPPSNSLSDSSAAGSALPPGTYPRSPADSDKKAETPPKEKAASSTKSQQKQPGSKAPKKHAPRSGS
jgi:hypothetical protein